MKSYSQNFNLKGKAALVTGATGILGPNFCHGLAESGANVAVVDIDPEGVKKVAAELREKYGIKTTEVVCDVSNPESVQAMVDQVVATLGGIDILHNNAATKSSDVRAFFASFEEYSLKTWREVMSVNLDGMFLVAQAVGRQMIKQKRGGSIIQTSSIYGLVGPDFRIYEGSEYMGGPISLPAVYSASKAGVIGLTRHLATLWATHNIRVNCVVPGGVGSGQNNEFARRYSERIPMGRMAMADELVGTLIFLASDASSYTTGQVLAIDGGLTAW